MSEVHPKVGGATTRTFVEFQRDMDHTGHLDIAAFDAALTTREIGRCVRYHESLPSTMDAAREAAAQGLPHGTLVFAGV